MTMTLEPGLNGHEAPVDLDASEVDAAWAATVSRRLHEIEMGKVQLVDPNETSMRLAALIRDWQG